MRLRISRRRRRRQWALTAWRSAATATAAATAAAARLQPTLTTGLAAVPAVVEAAAASAAPTTAAFDHPFDRRHHQPLTTAAGVWGREGPGFGQARPDRARPGLALDSIDSDGPVPPGPGRAAAAAVAAGQRAERARERRARFLAADSDAVEEQGLTTVDQGSKIDQRSDHDGFDPLSDGGGDHHRRQSFDLVVNGLSYDQLPTEEEDEHGQSTGQPPDLTAVKPADNETERSTSR